MFSRRAARRCAASSRPRCDPQAMLGAVLLGALALAGCDAAPASACVVPEGGAQCTTLPASTCPDPPLTYADVVPLITARCLGCHDGQGSEWPLTTYGHVADWQVEIRAEVSRCAMPPAESCEPLEDSERSVILAWISCGLPP